MLRINVDSTRRRAAKERQGYQAKAARRVHSDELTSPPSQGAWLRTGGSQTRYEYEDSKPSLPKKEGSCRRV